MGMVLELSYQCNLRCIHCYVKDKRQPEPGLLLSDYRQLARDMADLGVIRLIVTGGEPLAYPHVIAVLQTLADVGFVISLYTNGTLITPALAKRLAALELERVEISLYGADADVYERVTATAGSFAAFRSGLRYLQQAGAVVMLKPVFLADNVHYYDQMLAFAEQEGTALRFSYSPYLLADPGSNFRLSDQDMVALMAEEANESLSRRVPTTCQLGRWSMVSDPWGGIRPCVAYPHPIATLQKQSLLSIWRSSPTLAHCRAVTADELEECVDCEYASCCMPCLALNVRERGSLTEPALENCRIARNRRNALDQKLAPKTEPQALDGRRRPGADG